MPSVKLTLIADFKGASKEMQDAMKANNKAVKDLRESAKKIDTAKFDEFVTKSKVMGAAFRATRGPLQGAIMQQRNLARKIEKTIKDGLDPMADSMKVLRVEYDRVSEKVAKLQKEKKDLAAKTRALEKATRDEAKAMKQATDEAVRYAKYGLLALAAASTVLFGSMLKASTIIEDAQAAFRPMLGSLMKAEALVDMINETAAKTPFQFEAISMSVKQLLPAVKGNMGEVIKTFRMLGDVSSGNAQRLDSVTRAFTKSMLRGRVDMRSLNMIARAGVPIFSELSNSMGITTEQLFEMSKKGQISSNDLVKAFETMTSKGGMFYKGMEIASKTLTGRISTLKDNIMLLGVNIGNVLLPYAKAFVEVSLTAVGAMREWTKDTLIAKGAISLLALAIGAATFSLVAFIAVAKGAAIITALKVAVTALWAVMAANPLGLVLAGLIGLNAAIWTIGQSMGSLKFVMITKMKGIWEGIKTDFNIFKIGLERESSVLGNSLIRVLGTNVALAMKGMMVKSLGLFVWLIDKLNPAAATSLRVFHKMWKDSLEVKSNATANAADLETKALDDHYNKLILKEKKRNKEVQDNLKSRLKDAKLAAGGMDTGAGGLKRPPTLAAKLRDAETVDDKLEQLARKNIDAFKANMTNRMKVLKRAKGNEAKFLLDEVAKIRSLNTFTDRQKAQAAIAADELITEIQKKGSKKRVKNIRDEQKKTFAILLKEGAGDSKERQWREEREAFRTHLKDRMVTMRVAKEDESAFLEKESERLSRFDILSKDQKIRAEEVASQMILDIHKKHFEEMEKLRTKETEAQAKKDAAEAKKEKKRLAKVNEIMSRTKEVATRNADMVRSAIMNITDTMVRGAETGAYAVKDMFKSILLDIYHMMVNRAVTDFLSQLFPMTRTVSAAPQMPTTGGGMLGGMAIPQFALGTVATAPTLGIFGEKGPEAVMPLVRRNGVLGVAAPAGGGGGGGTTVNIIQGQGVEIEQETTRDAFGNEQINVITRQATKKDIDNGMFDSNLKRRYGLTPKAMGR